MCHLMNLSAMDLHVDENNVCASLTPCYTAIQTAVVNATPDSHILVFPGTYAEQVDISQMGTALGPATNGNIKFSSVDTNGQPNSGTALVSPATGIPFTHTTPTFNGNVEIDGLTVNAIDDDGIDFDLINGNITIRNVTANSLTDDGIDLEVNTGDHTIGIYNSTANNNADHGFNLDGPDGTVVLLHNNQTNNNVAEGVDIQSADTADVLVIQIIDLTANNNGDINNESAGVVIDTRSALSIANLTVNDNQGPGLVLFAVNSATITDSVFERNGIGNGYDGILFRAAGIFQVTRSTFTDNDSAGIWANDSISGQALSRLDVTCSQFSGGSVGVNLGTAMTAGANYTFNNLNFANHSTTALYAGVNNPTIDATNNYWNDATGPSHAQNVGGTGENISDINDDQVGGAQGTVTYIPFLAAPVDVEVFAADRIFSNDFDGNPCTLD